jgi:hypothetical protein
VVEKLHAVVRLHLDGVFSFWKAELRHRPPKQRKCSVSEDPTHFSYAGMPPAFVRSLHDDVSPPSQVRSDHVAPCLRCVLLMIHFILFVDLCKKGPFWQQDSPLARLNLTATVASLTIKDVVGAYRRLAMTYHPDKGHPDADIAFPRIRQAYETVLGWVEKHQ